MFRIAQAVRQGRPQGCMQQDKTRLAHIQFLWSQRGPAGQFQAFPGAALVREPLPGSALQSQGKARHLLGQAGLMARGREPTQGVFPLPQQQFRAFKAAGSGPPQSGKRLVQALPEFRAQRPEQLRRMGGRGRAQVGGQIRQGHIHLMADARQHGQP